MMRVTIDIPDNIAQSAELIQAKLLHELAIL
jgi:hypothetical protein